MLKLKTSHLSHSLIEELWAVIFCIKMNNSRQETAEVDLSHNGEFFRANINIGYEFLESVIKKKQKGHQYRVCQELNVLC